MDETTTLCVTVQNGEHLLSGPDWLKVSDSTTLIDVLVEVSGTRALGHQVQVVISKEPSFTEAALVQVLNPVSMLRISGSVYVKFLLQSSVLPVEHKYMDNKCKAERDTDVSPLHFLNRPTTISNVEENKVFSTINDTFDKPFESNYLNKLFSESKLSPSTIRSIKEELTKKHHSENTDSLTTWQQQSEISTHKENNTQQTKLMTSPEKELVRWGQSEKESIAATQESENSKTRIVVTEDKLEESGNIKTNREHMTSTAKEAEVSKTSIKREGSEGKDKKILSGKMPPLKASRSQTSKVKKIIVPGTVGPKAEKKDSTKTGMPILCHKTARPVSSKITSTGKRKKDSTKADWNTSVKSKIDCKRTSVTGTSAVKATAKGNPRDAPKGVNSSTRSSRQGKCEEGTPAASDTAIASSEKDRPTVTRKPIGKTFLSVTKAHKAANGVQQVRGKLNISKTVARSNFGKVKTDKSDATKTADLYVGIVNSMDRDRFKQQDKTLTIKAGTEKINDMKEPSVQEGGNRDELSISTNEDSGYDLSLGSFDGVEAKQNESFTTENTIDHCNEGVKKEEPGTELKKHDQSSVNDASCLKEVNLNVEDLSCANTVPNVNMMADNNFGSKDLLHERKISDKKNFESTESENGIFSSLIDHFTDKGVVIDEINGIMDDLGAINGKIVADENSTICDNDPQTPGDSILFNENPEIPKQSHATSITSDNQHGMDRKGTENLQKEFLPAHTTIVDGSFSKKDTIISTRSPFFCSLFDDPITNRILSSCDSLDYAESSEMTRKGNRTEKGIKRSESLNDNILSPSHKKSGFFHHLKELTVDNESSTLLSIATKADYRSADDIQLTNNNKFSVESNRSQCDIQSTHSSSKCHGDGGFLTSSSSMLNVTLDRDMDHDFSVLIGKELEINHDTKSELPVSLAEIGRESAISRTFTLDEENIDDVTAEIDQPNSNPRAAKVVKSETNPGDIAMNDSCEPEPHECNGTSEIMCSGAAATVEVADACSELDCGKDIECHIRRRWSFQFGIMDQLLLTSIVDLSRDLNVAAERISDKLNPTKSLNVEEARGSITGRTNIVDEEREELFHNLKKLERQLGGIEEAFDRQAS